MKKDCQKYRDSQCHANDGYRLDIIRMLFLLRAFLARFSHSIN